MPLALRRLSGWTPGAPAWGPAAIAGLGCALPLLLGLFSGHPGFLWATVGAFQASLGNPLHRFGMLRMLLITALGAAAAGIGFWAASHQAWTSLLAFATVGLLLAWLQRFGKEAGKLGLGIAVCLCLGQGQYGVASLRNPAAVTTLFALGGLWVCLLAFGLRGLHGLRMWPRMPRTLGLLRALGRHARRLPQRQWQLHALGCLIGCGLGGLIVHLAELPRGYWLTLTVFTTLQAEWRNSLSRILQAALASLVAAALLVALGNALGEPHLLVMVMLPLIYLARAFQANHYGLFVAQSTCCFLLLAESLAHDWHLPGERLLNALYGAAVALLVAALIRLAKRRLERRSTPLAGE